MMQIENLRFRWPGQDEWQIDIANVAVGKGEKVFLKGASGSGKSTLLSLVSGINVAESGQLRMLDTDITQLKNAERDAFRADNLGYIFQQFNLLPYLSVIDNVILPCRFSSSRAQKAGGNIEGEAKRLLLGLALPEACLHQPVTSLSIGQQQRAAAARALIGKPALVLADEPTSALDFDSRNTFVSLLMKECEKAGASLLFVSHDHSLESHFDRSVALSDINAASGLGVDAA
ncbi:ATP-binding cassette domain-containing protein [Enterovibrio sp. ZSDZ35]|uniref:ATP-binding cassette domain-containing protein n=1 Tax=Enterovibrio qingdaonensis TaxID=2899818 RepID=A0ABT5QH06_9GAMM|nr:ATP-binding cassette domain-containing protein [Enterovibrio sp. ZSDZ35]MDD1780248.1 ATP-binding cassette domain-containing protein [Enterovibrio sp. ZSDZ35]